jgi:thioredoxin-like negative regulator of GroEL
MSNVLAATDATFAQEIEQHDGLATEYAGRVRIAKLDADANQRTMVRLGVRGLPTLLFFRDGQLVDRLVGAAPRTKIEAKLLEHLEPVAA